MFDVNAETGEIFLYDVIGPAALGFIDAGAIIGALSVIGRNKRAHLRIASKGGNVDEAVAIFNALARHPGGVEVAIDSMAASAASYIAMVGEKITIAEAGGMMLHEPLTLIFGNARQLRSEADVLDTYRDRIIGAYQKRMKTSTEEVQAVLEAETWYTASAAVDAGLADAIGNATGVSPRMISPGLYKNTPQQFLEEEPAAPGSRTPYIVSHAKYKILGQQVSQKKTG